MDRRELLNDEQEALRMAMDGRLSSVWTAMPGIVKKVDLDKRTCEVQPAIQGRVQSADGSYKFVNLPLLVDVPIVMPSAGGFTLSLPIKAEDEVLVVFSSRCIDSWWQSGGVGVPMEQRMHDLSDGFAIPGPRSVATSTPLHETNAQLTSDDGSTFIELSPAGEVKVKALIFNVEAPAMNVTGNIVVTGNITAANVTGTSGVTSGTQAFNTHRHSTSTNPSGVPVP
jgi:hypothetical protein